MIRSNVRVSKRRRRRGRERRREISGGGRKKEATLEEEWGAGRKEEATAEVELLFFWQLRDFSNKLFRPFFSHFWLTVTNRGVPFSLKSDQVFFGVETGSRLLSESCQVCLLWWVTVVQHSCEFDCFVSLHLLLNDG